MRRHRDLDVLVFIGFSLVLAAALIVTMRVHADARHLVVFPSNSWAAWEDSNPPVLDHGAVVLSRSGPPPAGQEWVGTSQLPRGLQDAWVRLQEWSAATGTGLQWAALLKSEPEYSGLTLYGQSEYGQPYNTIFSRADYLEDDFEWRFSDRVEVPNFSATHLRAICQGSPCAITVRALAYGTPAELREWAKGHGVKNEGGLS